MHALLHKGIGKPLLAETPLSSGNHCRRSLINNLRHRNFAVSFLPRIISYLVEEDQHEMDLSNIAAIIRVSDNAHLPS